MSPKKIVILGGGMAGLSAAYELTRTDELAAQHDVTVYTLGWRLGGKCASSRDDKGRNIEHGLHVWFGCYANTFGMMKDVFDNNAQPPGSVFSSIEDVAKPQDYTPIGVLRPDGWSYFPVEWPHNDGNPWDTNLMPTLFELMQTILGWLWEAISHDLDKLEGEAPQMPNHKKQRIKAALERDDLHDTYTSEAEQVMHREGTLSHLWKDLRSFFGSIEKGLEDAKEFFEVIFELDEVCEHYRKRAPEDLRSQMIYEALVIARATFKGVFKDLIEQNEPFDSLDNEDFREWLIRHGAVKEVVETSSFIRVVYDTLYQFYDGDIDRPSYAAGTSIGVIGRLIATYKGHMMYQLQGGFGEAVVSPLYEAMLKKGVKFEFFSKVQELSLDESGKNIGKIRIGSQVALKNGTYDPVTRISDMTVWPSHPRWDQIVDGDRLKAEQVNFESHWCQEPLVAELELEKDKDFDTVILAITMGAYKKLNDDPTMCDALKAASPDFDLFTSEMGIVATQSVQLWFDDTPAELGWDKPKAAAVSGPEYLNIFADMSQVIKLEGEWAGGKPKSLYYLTGTYATDIYASPSADAGVPQQAWTEVRDQTIDWMTTKSNAMWPIASDGSGFKWSTLHAEAGTTGVDRLDQQYIRANIDPNECCVLSCAGMTQHRLGPDESGFDNLVLAGEATRHGVNTTSVEGAVMSGRAASRAICGSPEIVVGYDFLRRRPLQGPGQ
jgi:uncharacterized protein with NAD-binding domain and iron-sulfur cluster